MAGIRFTTWLSEDERERLRALEDEYHLSGNFIVRMALRAVLYGEPLPNWFKGDKRDSESHNGIR